MKNKKTIIVCIVAIVALVCITVGISLAFFNYAGTGTTDNTIETGNITFLYTETSSVGRGIAIEDAFPISNEEGKLLTGEGNIFDFNISSTTQSNTNIPFEITARINSESTLSDDVVVMYLTKVNGTNEEEILLDKFSNLTQTDKTSNYIEKVLYNGTVYSNDNYNQDYRLRMWITNDGTFEASDMGKTFKVNVNVYADAEVVTESQIALENNTNINKVLVNDTELVKVEDESYDYLTTLPEGTKSATLNVETEVPNAKVKVEKINNLAKSNNLTKLSTQVTLDNLKNGINLYKVTVTSSNEKVVEEYVLKVQVGNMCDFNEGHAWNFDYTGNEQEFTIPCKGTYKIETWGAQGSNVKTSKGGYGGYSTGEIYLNKNQNIYLNVGGSDSYNGGGKSYSYDNSRFFVGNGGGMTSLSLLSGLLKDTKNVDNIIIIAGGGGAAIQEDGNAYNGGSAGGYKGGIASGTSIRSHITLATGGTQENGGSFGLIYNSSYNGVSNSLSNGSLGLGGSNSLMGSDVVVSGGGAGYYGGGAGYQTGGAGGSGYIGNSLLTTKAMYCYNCEESNEVSTKTVSTTCYSSNPTENCAKEGNGYARITLVSLN